MTTTRKKKMKIDPCPRQTPLRENGNDAKNPILVDDYVYDDCTLLINIKLRVKALKAEPSSSSEPRRTHRGSRTTVIDVDAPPTPTVFCSICMEPKSLSESMGMTGCSHMFCVHCIRQYIAVKIQDNVGFIPCPAPDCNRGSLEPERCGDLVPRDVFERWCDVLCESMALGSTRVYCPFKDCSAPLMDEALGGEVILESECPHCWRLFCRQCRVPWHADMSCEQFQELAAYERDSDDVKLRNLAKRKKWQRCKKCKFFVEKVVGCRFVRCRCGHTFCYTCGTEMTIDHYCTVCKC